MDVVGQAIAYLLGFAAIYVFIIQPIMNFFKQAYADFLSLFTPQVIFYLIILGIVLLVILLLYIYTRIVIRIKNTTDERKRRDEEAEELTEKIKPALEKSIDYSNAQALRELRAELKELRSESHSYPQLSSLYYDLQNKISDIDEIMAEKEQEERISDMQDEEYRLKCELENLDKKIYLKQMLEKDKRDDIARKLDIYNHPVFIRDDLNEKQIASLLDNKYSKINEYCMIDKRIKTFLVAQVLNHSKTHTFLVWNVQELLKKIEGVEKIREHETVEADITFKYKSKNYAIEIETGTLLGKKKQTQDKVNSLNDKYPKRWFFIVSNKNLLSKYSKLGPTIQRKDAQDKLKQLLR